MEVHYLRSKVGRTTISRMVADQRPQDGIDWMRPKDWLFLGQPGELLYYLRMKRHKFLHSGIGSAVEGLYADVARKAHRNGAGSHIDRGRLSKA